MHCINIIANQSIFCLECRPLGNFGAGTCGCDTVREAVQYIIIIMSASLQCKQYSYDLMVQLPVTQCDNQDMLL